MKMNGKKQRKRKLDLITSVTLSFPCQVRV